MEEDLYCVEDVTVLQAIPATKAIPLCLITSAAEEGSGKKATKQGFSAYLTKPLHRPDLLDTLASMVKEKRKTKNGLSPLITRHTIHEAHYRGKKSRVSGRRSTREAMAQMATEGITQAAVRGKENLHKTLTEIQKFIKKLSEEKTHHQGEKS